MYQNMLENIVIQWKKFSAMFWKILSWTFKVSCFRAVSMREKIGVMHLRTSSSETVSSLPYITSSTQVVHVETRFLPRKKITTVIIIPENLEKNTKKLTRSHSQFRNKKCLPFNPIKIPFISSLNWPLSQFGLDLPWEKCLQTRMKCHLNSLKESISEHCGWLSWTKIESQTVPLNPVISLIFTAQPDKLDKGLRASSLTPNQVNVFTYLWWV